MRQLRVWLRHTSVAFAAIALWGGLLSWATYDKAQLSPELYRSGRTVARFQQGADAMHAATPRWQIVVRAKTTTTLKRRQSQVVAILKRAATLGDLKHHRAGTAHRDKEQLTIVTSVVAAKPPTAELRDALDVLPGVATWSPLYVTRAKALAAGEALRSVVPWALLGWLLISLAHFSRVRFAVFALGLPSIAIMLATLRPSLFASATIAAVFVAILTALTLLGTRWSMLSADRPTRIAQWPAMPAPHATVALALVVGATLVLTSWLQGARSTNGAQVVVTIVADASAAILVGWLGLRQSRRRRSQTS